MNNSIYKIEKQVWKTVNTETRIGVLDGLSGIALFYFYLTEIFENEEYETKLIAVVDRINFLISEFEYDSSFCAGIAGYGWTLLKLKNKSIEIEDEYFDAIDIILSESLISNYNNNYYDFLYGANGIAMYFIERFKIKKDKKIETVLIQFTNDLLHKINSEI
jgi:lantibiotic modifying enzyme